MNDEEKKLPLTLPDQPQDGEKIEQMVGKRESFWGETVKFVLITLAIVLPFRYFVAQPFIVTGASMDPTFANGQYLIVDEISYKFETPKRGDVIIFKYPYDQTKYFIKRIIGLPGETVILHDKKEDVKNASSTITLSEPYISSASLYKTTTILKNNQYSVMDDNRPESSDSRIWGPLQKDLIIGRPFLRLLPLKTLSVFPGDNEVSR